MADENKELNRIYSEINSIESKIGNLQSELNTLKNKLNLYVEKSEKRNKEEYTNDPILEEELTSPITGTYDSITNDELNPNAATENKPQVSPKEKLQTAAIVRPSMVIKPNPKKQEFNAPIEKHNTLENISSSQPPPDLFDDIKNWFKGKIGNIPIEEFLGVNLLNKIGLILLVVGFSFFLRLAYDWIGPFTKLGGMFVLSLAIFWGGDKLYKNKSYSVFGLGMIAASFSLFYFTVYASYNVEATRIVNTESGLIGFILLFFASGLMIAASLWYKKEILTSFAYFLGFITISINENSDFNYFSMLSVLFLSISLIGIMTVMRWKYLTGVGIFASYANYWLYAQGLPRTSEGYLLKVSEFGQNYFLESIIYLLLFWVIFFVSTFTMKVDNKKDEKIASAINIVNAFSFFTMFVYVNPEPTEWGAFGLTLGMGFVYMFGALLGRKTGRDFLWNSSLILGISLITLSIPVKFSDYGNVFGWLIEGSALVLLGFMYRETYLKNLGYFVLFINLGKFYSLPYGDFYYSATSPFLIFDLNRGMIYGLMIVCFYGLIPIIRKYISDWTRLDKFAYSSFGFLGSFTVLLFSFYLIQKPFQVYILIPSVGLLLILGMYLKNRNLYYSSVGLTLISLISSVGLIFPNKTVSYEINHIICSIFIIFANATQYYLGKENFLLKRYNRVSNKSRISLSFKDILMKGEIFIWVSSLTLGGLILNGTNPYLHSLFIILAAIFCFAVQKKYNQGNRVGILLYASSFFIGIYRYSIYSKGAEPKWSEETWFAIVNLFVFWISGFGVLYLTHIKLVVNEFKKIIGIILISATTVSAMLLGNILISEPYILSFTAIYSLLLIVCYKWIQDEFCIYNALVVSYFTLLFGLGGMMIRKESPVEIYEYMNLVTYTISSVLTTILCFRFTANVVPRILFYGQSLLSGICFVVIVIPSEYRPIAFLILHFGHIYFHIKTNSNKFYEYSYLTLGISVLSFLYQTEFLSIKIPTDTKSILLFSGYAGIFLLQTIFVFYRITEIRDKYLYYILNLIILFWTINRNLSIEYSVFLFSAFAYVNSFLLSRFKIKELEKLYYLPVLWTVFTFLNFLSLNKNNLLEEMNYKNFFIGIFTLFLVLRGVKDVEKLKVLETQEKSNKYSFEKIITLVLFLEFILLTMTVVDIKFWSLIWTIEAFAFISYGVFRNQSLIRYAGFGLIGLAVIKLGFWDLQNLKENVRVLVLISIGALFVIASFLYAKFKEKLFKKEE